MKQNSAGPARGTTAPPPPPPLFPFEKKEHHDASVRVPAPYVLGISHDSQACTRSGQQQNDAATVGVGAFVLGPSQVEQLLRRSRGSRMWGALERPSRPDPSKTARVIPVRCTGCGQSVNHLQLAYEGRLVDGATVAEALATVGAQRLCCRNMLQNSCEESRLRRALPTPPTYATPLHLSSLTAPEFVLSSDGTCGVISVDKALCGSHDAFVAAICKEANAGATAIASLLTPSK